MSESILVTGGSGFIGRRLVKLLISQGFRVKVPVRSQNSKQVVESLGGLAFSGDVTDYNSLRANAEGCSAVFHLAGVVSYKWIDKSTLDAVNVGGTRNIIELVKNLNIPKFIYCSSIVALGGSKDSDLDETAKYDGHPLSTYQETKCKAHDEVKQLSKLREGVVIAMPALAMGPGGTDILGIYIKAFMEGKMPFLIKLHNRVSYVYVDDVAMGLFLCFQNGKSGESYILSSESCSMSELASLLAKYSKRKVPDFEIAPSVAKPLVIMDEMLATITGRTPPLTLESLNVLLQSSWSYSGRKAVEQLGWRPQGLELMVKKTVEGMNEIFN